VSFAAAATEQLAGNAHAPFRSIASARSAFASRGMGIARERDTETGLAVGGVVRLFLAEGVGKPA
jgi:hypothetical protein